ncbi:MAG: lysophospholipid acyltransferase family protein, partial [Candidatus Nanopelagicales bacterium]
MLYWVLKWIVIGPWLRVLFRPWTDNMDALPVSGPALLVSNHLSFSDSFFLPLVTKRRITFLAKQEYFTGKGIKGLLSKMFFTGVGQVPIDRSSGRAAEAAITTGVRILR